MRLAGVLAAFALVLVGASQAMATTRYAVPGGNTSDPNCFAKSSNCSGQHALDVAAANDEVIFATGTYDDGSAQLTNNGNPGQDIHGEDAQPPPRIITTSNNFVFVGSGDDTSISHMTFEQHGTGGALAVIGGSVGHSVLVDTVQAVGASSAIFGLFGNTIISNTSAFANATNGIAMLLYQNETLRGVTAIAPANGGIAVQQNPNCCWSTSHGIIRNTILSGGSGGADLKTTTVSGAFGTVDIDFSNYANVSNCSGCTLTQGPNSQAIPPALADRANGNFHETFDSPTIDSGEDSANNGSFDVDGDARKIGPAPDIGADEFIPGQAPPGVNTTPPAPSTASVLPPTQTLGQVFPGVRLGVLKFTVKGNKSFNVPIVCPSFVTGSCVGTIVFVTASKVAVPKATAAAKKKLTIGKASFSIPHGSTKNVKIKLSKAAQKVLAAKGSLKAVDTLTVTANGARKTTRQTVTLKGKKKH